MTTNPDYARDTLGNIPPPAYKRIVVAGGGFAGIELVKKLKNSRYQIVLIDRNNYHTFQPLLYQVATAGLEPDSVAGPLRKITAGKNTFVRMANVAGIDRENMVIDTDLGKLAYDYLVIATGSRPNFFGKKEVAETAFPLKEVSDAYEFRAHLFEVFEKAVDITDTEELKAMLNVVIVGAGPTGVEMAGALIELKKNILPKDYPTMDFSKMQVHLVEGLDEVLTSMSDFASKKSLAYLKKMGVKVTLGSLVDRVEGDTVYLDNGETVRTKTLMWAAGVKGNVPGGVPEDKVNKSRILVDGYNRIDGSRRIFAIGDIAMMKSEKNPKGHPMLAPVAIQQGRHLAKNMLRVASNKSLKAFKYTNKGYMATIGRNKAVVDTPVGFSFGGFIAWLGWMFVHLASIIGFRRKIVVLGNWAWSYFTFNKGARSIYNTAKES